MTARPSGARKSAPSPTPSATGIIPAISANVVIRIGRRRTRPASMIAARRGIPCSCPHFAKSISRIAFLATMPIRRITPIIDIMFSVSFVMMSASTTPMSDSGSEMRMATGSRNEPNCITRIRYINSSAMPSAARMSPNTCAWSFASPPNDHRTPAGMFIRSSSRVTALVTSPSDRPETLACTTITLSRSKCEIFAGPRPCVTLASWPSGIIRTGPPCPPTAIGRRSMSCTRVRASGASRTRTFRFSPDGSTQSPASTPAKAGRSDWAICPTVTPIEPASARSSEISSSGFCPLVERLTSTAPGVARTILSTVSATCCSCRPSKPRSSSCTCLMAPPKPFVNTATVAPPICLTCSRSVAPN